VTVAEMIVQLKRFPPSAEVRMEYDGASREIELVAAGNRYFDYDMGEATAWVFLGRDKEVG